MKKEEFPTFLNEQPTVVFGRTSRELLLIAAGLAGAYLLWQRFNLGGLVFSVIFRIVGMAIIIVFTVIVAFVKVSTRPLEEWAIVGLSYMILPKVYLYMPPEEAEEEEKSESEQDGNTELAVLTEDEEDRYS